MNQLEFSNLKSSLETLSTEQLRDLNTSIVKILKNNFNHQAIVAASKFSVGDNVQFRDHRFGNFVQGTITKINTKSINVSTPNGNWKVSPGLLSKV